MIDALGLVVCREVIYPLKLISPGGGNEFDEIIFRRVKIAKREDQNQRVFQITEVRVEGGAGVKEPLAISLELTIDGRDGTFAGHRHRYLKAFFRLLPEEVIFAKVQRSLIGDRDFPSGDLRLRKRFHETVTDAYCMKQPVHHRRLQLIVRLRWICRMNPQTEFLVRDQVGNASIADGHSPRDLLATPIVREVRKRHERKKDAEGRKRPYLFLGEVDFRAPPLMFAMCRPTSHRL